MTPKIANEKRKAEPLALVAEPASPALNAQPVGALHVLAVKIQRKREQGGRDCKEEEKDEALGPAIAAQVHGRVADPGDDAELQQQEQRQDAPGGVGEVHGDAVVIERGGARHLRGGEGVGGVVAFGGGDGGGLSRRGRGIGRMRKAGQECQQRGKGKQEGAQAHETPLGGEGKRNSVCRIGAPGANTSGERVGSSNERACASGRLVGRNLFGRAVSALNKRTLAVVSLGSLLVGGTSRMHAASGPPEPVPAAKAKPDSVLLQVMESELKRAMSSLGSSAAAEAPAKGAAQPQPKPYFMSYAVSDSANVSLLAQFGALTSDTETHHRTADVQVRLGSEAEDNTHGAHRNSALTTMPLPLDRRSRGAGAVAVVRHQSRLWACARQLSAGEDRAAGSGERRRLRPPTFPGRTPANALVPVDAKFAPGAPLMKDKAEWERRRARAFGAVQAVSGYLRQQRGAAGFGRGGLLRFERGRTGVDAEPCGAAGDRVPGARGATAWNCIAWRRSRAMSWDGCRSRRSLVEKTLAMAKNLEALRVAPVTEPFDGPAILSGRASRGVLPRGAGAQAGRAAAEGR